MSDEQTPLKTPANPVRQPAPGERVIRPAVDILEDATGITIKADLPGVSNDRLHVQVEGGDTLTIFAEASVDIPEGMEAVYADINTTRYQRSFTLSKELDPDNISAELRNGELTLRLTKRPEMQPRRIAVSAA
ncbi:MAG: Hsp20/alpha crystallin family protein [Thiomonas sp.]|uniref:Hsp20/alpha crystallin family protein n=1 Tax=Thiomonas sp. TaxID=2047785 RepID=UPI002A35FBFA|nr:Hsp20/alpha crystallin family protein [Thiomonas sp.]MDY0330688.1 Hsp20/alpha crystallin family protein [Thiomonas sp.]